MFLFNDRVNRETAQELDRNDVTYRVQHPGPEAQVLLMFALTDFTWENGATKVILAVILG